MPVQPTIESGASPDRQRLLESPKLFFALTLVGGPLLAYGVVMLVTDGAGLLRGDSAALIPIGLGTPALATVVLGRIMGRTRRQIALAVIASVVLTVVIAIALIVVVVSTLSSDFS